MKISGFVFFVAVLGGLAPAARAMRNPQPPPSGIVVHLFGPNSITSNILPNVMPVVPHILPGAPQPDSGAGADQSTAAPQAAAPGPAMPAPQPAYVEPTIGQVLHQMFVVGDPDQKPGEALSKGRTTERP